MRRSVVLLHVRHAFAVGVALLVGCGPQVAVDDTTTSTTSPPSDDDVGDDDDCWTGGIDCCDPGECCDDGCTSTGGEFPEIGGDFLFAFTLVPIASDLPLQYLATIDVLEVHAGGLDVSLELQPLTLDTASTTVPREPLGAPIVLPGSMIGADLSFELPIGMLFAAGETNAITGSDIQMENVIMTGTVLGPDDLCGTATGDIVSPISASLDGSTFAMVRVPDPMSLPLMFPLGCP